MLEFEVTFMPDPPSSQIVKLTRLAEEQGFTYGWLFDSHLLWMEPYPLLTLMAVNTTRMRLGTCVTNPGVRDPSVTASLYATLNEISGGRMIMGMGRGDSSRRVMGKTPMTLETMERAIHEIRTLASGQEYQADPKPIQIKWASGNLPVYVAAYGPKALHLAGRIADGVILQFADPHLIKWCLGFVREGAAAAGRDPGSIQVMAAAPVWASDDLAVARDHVRW